MNPLLKNLVFSTMATQFENIAKQAMKKKYEKELKTNKDAKLFECGKILRLSFLVEKTKTTQNVEYENYKGSEVLTEEEKNKFAAMLNVDMKKEESKISETGSPILDIVYIANFPTKTLNIFYTFQDKSIKKIVI